MSVECSWSSRQYIATSGCTFYTSCMHGYAECQVSCCGHGEQQVSSTHLPVCCLRIVHIHQERSHRPGHVRHEHACVHSCAINHNIIKLDVTPGFWLMYGYLVLRAPHPVVTRLFSRVLYSEPHTCTDVDPTAISLSMLHYCLYELCEQLCYKAQHIIRTARESAVKGDAGQ